MIKFKKRYIALLIDDGRTKYETNDYETKEAALEEVKTAIKECFFSCIEIKEVYFPFVEEDSYVDEEELFYGED